MKSNQRIFLCHAQEDKQAARKCYEKLKAKGYAPWLDEVDLLAGQDWDREIRRAIRNSALMLVFLSGVSVAKRGYIQKEFRLAVEIASELPEGQTFIIPVKLDNCNVPDIFFRIQWLNLYESDGYEKLFRCIGSYLGTDKSESRADEPADERPLEKPNALCSSDSCTNPRISVPRGFFDADGLIKHEFRNRDFEDFYVSPLGYVYCSRQCWAQFLE